MFRLFKKKDSFIVLFRTCRADDDIETGYLTKEIVGVTDSQFTANRIAFSFANAVGEVLVEKRGGYSRNTDLEKGRIFLTSTLDDGTKMQEVISIEKWTKE